MNEPTRKQSGKGGLLIGSIVVIMFFMICLGTTMYNTRHTKDFVKTTGQVIGVDSRRDYQRTMRDKRSTRKYYVTIQYRDKDGKEYTSEERYFFIHPRKGNELAVYYNPKDPSELKPQMLPFYIGCGVSGALSLLFGYGLVSETLKKTKKKEN